MVREISVLAFNFTKISAQKYQGFEGEIKINPNINIASIEKHELKLLKQDAVKIKFSFNVNYKDLADVNLDGDLILRVDSKTQKDLIKGWKDKNLDGELQTGIINLIMQKSSIRAIEIEDEMGLPIHIQIPKLQVSKKE
jgi:hypothetical protein